MTKLQLFGSGFWNSDCIIVKISPKSNSPYITPRSCTGQLAATGIISCKPPKFSEMGEYIVSLSMDGGTSFLKETCEMFIYRDITLIKQSPELVDIRSSVPFNITIVSFFFFLSYLIIWYVKFKIF
jgi:hypothetical protein